MRPLAFVVQRRSVVQGYKMTLGRCPLRHGAKGFSRHGDGRGGQRNEKVAGVGEGIVR